MFVTKEEALTKWCPMARVSVSTQFGVVSNGCNRIIEDGKIKINSSLCIGEKCMMFMQVPPKKSTGRVKYTSLINHDDLYYCGLQ